MTLILIFLDSCLQHLALVKLFTKYEKHKDWFKLSFSGDTNSITFEPLPDSDEDHIQEDLGKLTKVDKARIGRVRTFILKLNDIFFLLTTYVWLMISIFPLSQ